MPTSQPVVIAIDDWMVFARDAEGRIVETCAEMWPEWLDFAKAPEEMDDDEYRVAILQILRTKRPQWSDMKERAIATELAFAQSRGVPMTRDDAIAELGDLLDISTLVAAQATFISAHR